MPVDIMMPGTGGEAGEAGIARWNRRPGDAVRKGEALLDIETDKALVEVEAPADGVLARIVVDEGGRAAVGAIIGVLALAGEDVQALAAPSPAPAASVASAACAASEAAAVLASAAAAAAAATASAAAPAPAPETVSAPETAPAPETVSAPAHATASASSRVRASPLARRLAARHAVDLATLRGSGPRGRVVKIDIDRALAATAAASAPAVAGVRGVPAAGAPAVASAAGQHRPPAGATDVPHSAMRRVIAQRLAEAKRNIPHFYLSIDCDVDALLALRSQLEAQAGFKPSVNDFVVKAVALSMKRVPAVNASWGDDAMRCHASVDVSVAVTTPGGLMTPIVRDADAKRLAELSAEMKALAARAREGRLRPDEYQGGGFTVSNLGMYGVRDFYAIVNPPQAAILAVGACEQRPVVRDGALAIGTRMTCSLSADHRVVDGAVGAEFLAALRGLLEAPLALLV